jgi:hypothetical protein
MLDLGLDENTFIKTKGVQSPQLGIKKSKIKKKPLDPENIARIENDVSFNYASSEFKFEDDKAC